jgi:hypothetical protein
MTYYISHEVTDNEALFCLHDDRHMEVIAYRVSGGKWFTTGASTHKNPVTAEYTRARVNTGIWVEIPREEALAIKLNTKNIW